MKGNRRWLEVLWTVGLILVGSCLVLLCFYKDFSLKDYTGTGSELFVIIACMAFFAEYIDSSLGMGYGTTLTPVLLIFGFTPMEVVPAILISEFATGILSGICHHKFGNVDLSKGSHSFNIMLVLAGCSLIGTITAVILAVNLPKFWLKLYISIMIILIGLFIQFGKKLIKGFSWKKLIGLGVLAAFNKGLSGGGYGPLVTGGQTLVGVPPKNAVSITSFAEGIVCLVGIVLYLLTSQGISSTLILPLVSGALLSAPLAAWTVRILPENFMRSAIGYTTIFLGVLTLFKLVL